MDDGRCICKDSTATLTTSTELSTAYTNKCSNVITTNTNDLSSQIQANIFPNPTNSELILELSQSTFGQDDRFILFSIFGEHMQSANINAQQSQIEMSNYPRGIYILVVTINGKTRTFKILKE